MLKLCYLHQIQNSNNSVEKLKFDYDNDEIGKRTLTYDNDETERIKSQSKIMKIGKSDKLSYN